VAAFDPRDHEIDNGGMLRLAPVLLVVPIGSVACSSDSPSAPAACNALVNDGPTITIMASTSGAPAPTGGTIVDGTYVLTAATVFGVSSIPQVTASAVFQFSGNTMQQVGTVNGQLKRYTSTFTTMGTSISTTDTCPAPDMGTYGFSATATEISVFDTRAALGVLGQTYTKR
jgi:hypothetical protein